MRNLCYRRRDEIHVDGDLPITATTWDPSTNSVICTFGPTIDISVIFLKRKTNPSDHRLSGFSQIASWDAPRPSPDLACDKVVSLQYFPDASIICVVLAGGDLIVVRENPLDDEDKIEIVGTVDVGITAAAWAPDEELLLLTTRAGTLLYMTREFDNVANASFSVDDLKASNQVSVGWGKVETQFKGKRAKSLKDPTVPDSVDEGKLAASDNREVTISWRGDGSFVAVNSVESGVRRVIRVYSREGILDSVSEPVDGLTSALSWRPSGNLIAGIQRRPNRVDVVFFERNGLRHGQFSLRLSEDEMSSWASDITMCWNISSSALALCFYDRIQIWTMGNYHYYLKQEIPIPVNYKATSIPLLTWHSERQFRFAATSGDCLIDVEFALQVIRGPTTSPNDHGIVAVIDGRILKLTPFRVAVVPPPLAAAELEVNKPIIDTAISSSGQRIVVLTHQQIYLFTWRSTPSPIKIPSLIKSIKLHDICFISAQFLDEDRVDLLSQDSVHFSLSFDGGCDIEPTPNAHEQIFSSPMNPVIVVCPTVDGRTCRYTGYVKGCYGYGSALELQSNTYSVKWEESGTLKVSQPHLSADGLSLDLSKTAEKEKVVGSNVNSYIVANNFLFFTTTRSLLKCVRLTSFNDIESPPDTSDRDERSRSIEKGALIVTACPTDYKVILQMPRGNLETVYPRMLVLSAVRQFLDQKKYKAAFDVCRKNMVDVNILHDHDPPSFMSDIITVISQLESDDLNEFLVRLSETDVCLTLYKDTSRKRFQGTDFTVAQPSTNPSKVNRICDAMIRHLKDESQKNWSSLMSAYVSKSPPDLEAALTFIQSLASYDARMDAVSLICFLADVNRLSDAAIGLYDLELAVTLNQEAQKDPKEYLPWIRQLQKQSDLRRRFLIDCHLKRNAKALAWLFEMEDYDEMLSYAEEHNLYQECLEHCKYLPEARRKTQLAYARHLFRLALYKDAAIVYESIQRFLDASRAYAKANMWRESLNAACADSGTTAAEVQSLASSLEHAMVVAHDYTSAARINAEYLDDIPRAAILLCQAFSFADAIGLLRLRGLEASHPDLINSGLIDGMTTITELLSDCKSQLNTQVPRVRELRIAKTTDPVSYYDNRGNANEGEDFPDDVSLAPTDASTTGGSLFTKYTRSSGKTISSRQTGRNRRREERKKARGKRGTIYEEEYLVASVGRLVERINSVNEDVVRLITGLASRGKIEEAKAVRNAMRDVVELCQTSLADVFPCRSAEEKNPMERGRTDGVRFDNEEGQLDSDKTVPSVKQFELFSFLGN